MPGIGDIITYRMDDMLVTHRVTDKRDSAYITRGDANEGEDAAPVMQEQIVGTVVFFIPVLGYVAAFLKSKPVFGLISLMLIQELFFLGMQWKGVCRQFCTDRKYEKSVRNKSKAIFLTGALCSLFLGVFLYLTDYDKADNQFTGKVEN